MKTTTKIILGLLALVIIIALSTVLYNNLSKQYMPDSLVGTTKNETQSNLSNSNENSEDIQPVLAPDFSMEDSKGNTVNLSDFVGKPIVLNFWASWCPPCKAEMPDFETVYQELGEDVVFIMLNATDGSRETKEKAQKFIEDQGFSFPVFFDTSMEASYTYGITSLPTSLFIDKDGYLVTGSIGMMSESSLRKGIEIIMEDKNSN